MDPTTWSVQARNLPEHASNPIHTDEGGRAAGFDAALVAGVTVYAPDNAAFQEHVLGVYADSKYSADWPEGLVEAIQAVGQ